MSEQQLGLGVLLWCAAMGCGYLFYRPRCNAAVLASGLFAGLIVVLFAIGRLIFAGGNFSWGVIAFPIMAAIVFFYTSSARRWLKGVMQLPIAKESLA
jgi:predicted lipid-binding transport protein (Tim44 family)